MALLHPVASRLPNGGSITALVLAAGVATATAGCSALPFGSADDQRFLDAGEQLIEGELAIQIGLGVLDASCNGRGLAAGETFSCTAHAAGHPPISFVATISGDGESVDLASTNLLLADQVEEIETFAASLISQETGLPIDGEDFECADNSLVVGAGSTIDCLVTDPTDQTTHTVGVTIDDLDSLTITIDVGDPLG